MGEFLHGTPEEYRAYRACKMFGWTPTQYEEAPANFVDLAFAFEGTEHEERD